MGTRDNPPVETQESIGTWAIETFGQGQTMRPYARRILAEVEELVRSVEDHDDNPVGWELDETLEEVALELADVLITIRVMAHRFRIDLDQRVDEKMYVNRYMRKWVSNGDGTGRHARSQGDQR